LPYMQRNELHGLPVVALEGLEKIYPPGEHEIFVAIVYTGLNRLRTRLVNEMKMRGYSLASYISPRAYVWPKIKLGEHCFIFENNTIQPFVIIGNNVILWSGNHIGHHSAVRNNCFISSQVVISGFCEIGENTFIGVNASIANNVSVGSDNWIGPSALISEDTEVGSLFKAGGTEKSRVSALRFFKVRE
jgi:sugar O-acyltransferase (sialic acid O-acetyltransferase NeuD family)